jgi:hypothetical protein
MQAIAEMISYGGAMAYIVLLLGLFAFPVSIAALVIALVSRKRKLGMIFGLTTIGLAAGAFLAGALGYLLGMSEAEAALAYAAPEQILPMATRGVGMTAPLLGMGAALAGLPFVLGVLALCRAAMRPAAVPAEPTADEAAGPVGSKGAAVVSAILPGASAVLSIVLLVVTMDGAEGLARMLSEAGGWGLLQLLSWIAAVVLLSILGPKVARGRRVPIAALLLLAALPWLAGFSAYVFSGAEALNAIESAAPEYRAAVMARGVAISLNTQMLGSVASAWLLLAVGLGLGLAARGQRAEGRTGLGWLFGALAGVPLLVLAGMGLAGAGGSALLAALGAIAGLVATMLGGSAMGDDGPHHRSVSLGVGAAAAAGLACAALCFATTIAASVMGFVALESAAPESRAQLLAGAARSLAPAFAARDFGWLIALLPAGVLALIGLKRTGISSGRVAAAALAAIVFALAPVLSLAAMSSLELPEWARPRDPWATVDPSFRPPVVGPLGCELSGGSEEPDAVVGVRLVTIQGRPAGDLADPNVQGQLPGWFSGALAQKRAIADRRGYGSPAVLRIAVDDGLPAPYLALVLRAAEAAGATSTELVGAEAPSNPVDPAPIADLHPLLVVYASSLSGRICALPIRLGGPPVDGPEAAPIWYGVIGAADEIDLALIWGTPREGSGPQKRLRVPGRSPRAIDELDRGGWSLGEAPRGHVLFAAEQTVTTGKMILAAVAAQAQGLSPSFPDPQVITSVQAAAQARAARAQEAAVGLGNLDDLGAAGSLRVSPGMAAVKGSLSKEEIRRIVQRHINEIKYCYERELQSKPELAGRVSVKFIISGTGAVQMAAVASSTLNSSEVESCMTRAIKRWTFPPPEGGGIVVVTYPFAFSSGR